MAYLCMYAYPSASCLAHLSMLVEVKDCAAVEECNLAYMVTEDCSSMKMYIFLSVEKMSYSLMNAGFAGFSHNQRMHRALWSQWILVERKKTIRHEHKQNCKNDKQQDA